MHLHPLLIKVWSDKAAKSMYSTRNYLENLNTDRHHKKESVKAYPNSTLKEYSSAFNLAIKMFHIKKTDT